MLSSSRVTSSPVTCAVGFAGAGALAPGEDSDEVIWRRAHAAAAADSQTVQVPAPAPAAGVRPGARAATTTVFVVSEGGSAGSSTTGAHAAAGDLTMNTTLPPDRPDQTTLSAWLDGELDATTRAQVDAWLRDHPEEAAQVRLWAADRDALRARFDPVLDEPIPPALLQAVQQHTASASASAAANQANWRRVAVVAGLLLTGGLDRKRHV